MLSSCCILTSHGRQPDVMQQISAPCSLFLFVSADNAIEATLTWAAHARLQTAVAHGCKGTYIYVCLYCI